MKRRIQVVIGFLFLFVNFTQAQYTQVGDGGFASFAYGPLRTDSVANFYNRFAYIYPQGAIATMNPGDTIRALEFKSRAFDSLVGTCNIKMYIKATSDADFGPDTLNWLAETRDNMVLVYEGNPKSLIGNSPSDVNFIFNQAPYYVFDTTGGAVNFQLLIEFDQQTAQAGPMAWYVESSFYVPAFISTNETKFISGSSIGGMDSMLVSTSSLKPTLRIYHPNLEDDIEVKRIYALGTVPTLMGQADSIKAVIANVGTKPALNHKIYLRVAGGNTALDSIVVPSLNPYEERMIFFVNHQPVVGGFESLEVEVESDQQTANNSVIKNRMVNYNVYSHADPFSANSGGIGFNGSTGEFVGKFYVNGSSFMNQIKVDFNSTGRAFQLGVWDDDGVNGTPGTELYMSDTAYSTPGTFIMPVLPRVAISGGFYVGIRQAENVNVGFSFQFESPIRPNTFFFAAPAGDSTWVPFDPGFDFNFNIQPRLQVGNDVAVLSIDNPADSAIIDYSDTDSLDMKATFINYGFINQSLFNVKMEVLNRFSQVVYTSNRVISLNADDTLQVTFDKFSLYNLGEFTARATAELNIDSVQDNNVLENEFQLVKQHDVAVDIIFSPVAGDSLEVNQESFWPAMRVNNYGLQPQFNFPVTGELVQNGVVLRTQTINMAQLNGGVSEIVNMDSMTLPTYGTFEYRAFTSLSIDSFPENDTVSVIVFGKKSHDLQVTSFLRPTVDEKFALNASFKPYVNIRNDGLEDEDSVHVVALILDLDSNELYRDSQFLALNLFSTTQVLFADYPADSLGEFICEVRTSIPVDQEPANDVLYNRFMVVEDRDLKLDALLNPVDNEVYEIANPMTQPQVFAVNNGFQDISGAEVILWVEDNTQSEVYRDTVSVNLLSGEQTTLTFYDFLSFANEGDYYVTVINTWASEQTLSANDTILAQYSVRFKNDLMVAQHLMPAQDDTLDLFDIVNARVQLINIGIDSILSQRAFVEITAPSGMLVVSDSFIVQDKAINEAELFNSGIFWPSNEVGTYSMRTFFNRNDDRMFNNSLTTTFEVVKRKDAEVKMAGAHPDAGESLPINTMIKPFANYANDGLEAISVASIKCEVFVDGTSIYSDSYNTSFAIGESKLLTFDSSLTHSTVSNNALVRFVVAVNGDDYGFNDTLENSFSFYDNASTQSYEVVYTKVFPNPFKENIRVTSSKNIAKVVVLNSLGQEVKSLEINGLEAVLPLALPQGTYLLDVYTSAGIERHRVVQIK